jgi:hypothetical protein
VAPSPQTQNFLSSTDKARASSPRVGACMSFWAMAGVPFVPLAACAPICRGELLALLFAGLALPDSELAGVGCSRAERLALLPIGAPLTGASECDDRGGETDRVLVGGVPIGPVADVIAGRGPCAFLAPPAVNFGSIMAACCVGACNCCSLGDTTT